MIAKKSIGPLAGVGTAIVFGSFVLVGILDYWRGVSIRRVVLLSVPVFVAFYFAGTMIEVRKERNKKLPTSSKELDSQGRPQSRR